MGSLTHELFFPVIDLEHDCAYYGKYLLSAYTAEKVNVTDWNHLLIYKHAFVSNSSVRLKEVKWFFAKPLFPPSLKNIIPWFEMYSLAPDFLNKKGAKEPQNCPQNLVVVHPILPTLCSEMKKNYSQTFRIWNVFVLSCRRS